MLRVILYPHNSQAPGRCDGNCEAVISEHMLRIKSVNASWEITIKWIPKKTFDGESTLIQVMSWCRQQAITWDVELDIPSHEKKMGHRDCSPWAHGELTVSSRWPKWSQQAVTEPWPGPWLSCNLAVAEPWSYWRCRDWAVTSPWLSCDLAVTELWPRRDWAVTSPSRDWAVIIGPRSRDHRGHRELTVSSRWPFIFPWAVLWRH